MNKRCLTLLLFCLCACNTACEKEESDYPSYISFTTVGVFKHSTDKYFFILDDGTTAYPGDSDRVAYNSRGKGGRRAVIYYNFLPQPASGFDRNIALYDIVDIPSKSIVTADNEVEVLVLGNDPIGVDEASISGRWLDISCYYHVPPTVFDHSKISLVDNQTVTPPADMPEGYTYLELRLNTGSKRSGTAIRKTYVAYRLESYAPEFTGSKGIYLKVTPPDGDTKYLKLDYGK